MPPSEDIDPSTIIEFWQKAGPDKWFVSDPEFDQEIKSRFSTVPDQALAGKYDKWGEQACKCLALILILDQFPRNIYRSSPKAFAYDETAKEMATKIIDQGFDQTYQLPLKPLQECKLRTLPFHRSSILWKENFVSLLL